jgi:plasmid maintenance system antidote protein VapI
MPIAPISSNLVRKDGMVRTNVAHADPRAILPKTACRSLTLPARLASATPPNFSRRPRPITPEMALRVGKFCSNGPVLWLRMQFTYDWWHARQEIAGTLDHIPTMKAKAA